MSFEETRAIPDPTQWVTTRELMEHLRIVSANTVTNYIKAGMPHHRLGGRTLLFDLAEVDEWVRSRWTASAPRQTA